MFSDHYKIGKNISHVLHVSDVQQQVTNTAAIICIWMSLLGFSVLFQAG